MQCLIKRSAGNFARGLHVGLSVTVVSSSKRKAFTLGTKSVARFAAFEVRTSSSLTVNRFISQLVDFKMEEPHVSSERSVLVRRVDGMETMNISFNFHGKDHNLLRGQSETLERTFTRISQNFKKLADKSNKRRVKKLKKGTRPAEEEFSPLISIPECSIFHEGNRLLPLETPNQNAWIDGAVFRIGELAAYNIQVNTPTVIKLKLPSYIVTGCPLFPLLEAEFAEEEFCQFSWFSQVASSESNSTKDPSKIGVEADGWKMVSNDRVYTPTLNEIGESLLLRCKPSNGGRTGDIVEVVTSAVNKGPDDIPFVRRHKETSSRTTGKVFRVVGYNLLADVYTNSEFARDSLFPHCPPEFLDGDYRQQLLLKEIIGYHGDILCLQEVDKGFFERRLQPALGTIGLEGALFCKSGGVSEGEAMFYQKDRYRLIGQHDIVLSETLKADPSNGDILAAISNAQCLLEKFLSKSTVAQVMVLDDLQNPGERLIVSNTHLYFHPSANHVRMVQTALILRHIQRLIDGYQEQDSSFSPSVVFAGDLNSTDKSGAYQLISSGRVPANSVHWYTGGREEFCGGMELRHQLRLRSACPEIPYTNYVPAFMETIDHVVYSEGTIGVQRVVPMPSHGEVTRLSALPNEVFPSDHLALVCDLRWLR